VSEMPQFIIGAGMAGLLAARMLSRHDCVVLERSPELPHNHSAVLRFSSSKVADVLGIPFRRVTLTKTVVPWRNPVADAMQYAYKVLGEYRTDRSVLLPERWTSSERWIAPLDLIERMADGLAIEYGRDYDFAAGNKKVISTVPMPVLARAMGYRDLGWKWVRGMNVRARLKNCDAFCSVMVPDPEVSFYRASITGDELIVELAHDVLATPTDAYDVACEACSLLGFHGKFVGDTAALVRQEYGKIAPIDEAERKNFIFWASTVKGRAYQLGRYATWRPRLLLDDLVADVRRIESWMMSRTPEYDQEQHRQEGSPD